MMNETGNSKDNVQEEKVKEVKEKESGQKEKYDIDLILDIPLDVSVELGKVRMLVNNLLQLGQGSIIELDKPVGEPLEIYINNKLIARGEVVVVEEKFGIRVTDVVSPLERVKSLG
ncbi:MAG: flagellar motor switch protein FliN [Deltaproteobacteria bacterium]|nr:MAG: flagellar motor switch protein FliN [Deltaproteobacteria bacterium]